MADLPKPAPAEDEVPSAAASSSQTISVTPEDLVDLHCAGEKNQP